MGNERIRLGAAGESAAAEWYVRHGYEVVARNWRCRLGEIDLIVASGDVVVFCEVKTRSSDAFGTGGEAVDHRKRRRIRQLAAQWLSESGGRRRAEVRFDVAVVRVGPGVLTIDVVEAAF